MKARVESASKPPGSTAGVAARLAFVGALKLPMCMAIAAATTMPIAMALAGCRSSEGAGLERPASEGGDADGSDAGERGGALAEASGVAPKGMVYVPPGVLIAGTPEDQLPRVVDAEMPGAQVVMRGFYIDELPYPNEAGAIAVANLTQAEAAQLCERQGKRLCTELEWERACKGPEGAVYPYGNTYRSDACGTGVGGPTLPPMGQLIDCRSGFGVRDLHGGVWQWTSSAWGRGTTGDLVTLRGGNGPAGHVVGRCANAEGRPPGAAHATYGARCCLGPRNLAEVTLDVVRGEPLRGVPGTVELSAALEREPPSAMLTALVGATRPFKVLHTWRWRPVGNEELVLQSGCAQVGVQAACGVAVGRARQQRLEPLGFAAAGWWLPALHDDVDPRELWVFGGDQGGAFRRRLSYTWGTVTVGEPDRNVTTKKDKKGKRKGAPRLDGRARPCRAGRRRPGFSGAPPCD